MGQHDFTSKDCIRVLLQLGFWDCSTRRGDHFKYCPPEHIKNLIEPGRPQFITVPKSRKIHCQDEILGELLKMGGKDLKQKFIDRL